MAQRKLGDGDNAWDDCPPWVGHEMGNQQRCPYVHLYVYAWHSMNRHGKDMGSVQRLYDGAGEGAQPAPNDPVRHSLDPVIGRATLGDTNTLKSGVLFGTLMNAVVSLRFHTSI